MPVLLLFQMAMAVVMNVMQGLALGMGFAVGAAWMAKRLK
jgi:hypothetical protein